MPKDVERADRTVSALSQGGSQSGIGGKLYALIKSRLCRVLRLSVVAVLLTTLCLLLISPLSNDPQESLRKAADATGWQWPSFNKGSLNRYNVSADGPVRMVVFGMPDLASGSGAGGKSWTDALCIQLGCSSLTSMIPDIGVPNQAASSHSIFQSEWDSFISSTTTKEPSGQNYHFLTEQYPLDATSDLAQQVKAFLAQPRPAIPPRETIWVVSLGTWDVWTMASLPRETAKTIAKKTIDSIFDHIDILYEASLDPSSVAYSDFWHYAADAEGSSRAMRENDTLQTPESFRFVIPEIADITMAPGWDISRPLPPKPHRRDDHMATGSFLQGNWNTEVKLKTAAWNKKLPPGIVVEEEQDEKKEGKDDKPKPRELSQHALGGHLRVPYPRRQGLQVAVMNPINDAIRESEMREKGLSDALGRGQAEQGDPTWYENTRQACVGNNRTVPADATGGNTCDDPESYLFFKPFQLGQRAVYDIARKTADLVAVELFGSEVGTGKKGWFT